MAEAVKEFINKEDEFISSEQKECRESGMESKMAEEITVERVSPFGLMVGGAWINGDKAANINFKDMFHAGDVLSIVKNGKGFITSAELVTKAPEKKTWTGPSKFGGSGGGKSEFRTTEQIIRSEAAKAAFCVLAGPVVANMSKEEAQQTAFDLAEHVATYIEEGV